MHRNAPFTYRRVAGVLLTAIAIAVGSASVVGAAEADDIAAAKAGTAAFSDVAAAEAAGYGLPPEGPLHECIASFDNTGAMGFHYINGDLVGDTELDPATPEALVYEKGADGSLTLVALEYVVFAEAWDAANDEAPMLFGQMFMRVDEPNRYELPAFYALHAWVWKDNPSGMFASFNPNVTCGATMPNTALPGPSSPLPIAGIGLVVLSSGLFLARRRRLGASHLS
jgi:hypothetical protein